VFRGPAEIPSGWEVTLDLVRRVAALRRVTDEPDWAAWHKATFGTEPKYSELLDQLASTPDERRSVLHSYIEPDADDIAAGRKTPTRAHLAIARMVAAGHVRVIITTNFDRLIENALRESGVEPTVITSDDALKGAIPLIHSPCYVVKIHGDYLDTRIRNTDSELGAYTPELDTLLDRIIDEHGLIVAETLVGHRAGRVITIEGADAFFERLEALVSVQADAQRPNPRSAGLNRLEVKTTEVQSLSENMVLATGESRVSGKNEKGDPLEITVIWTALDVRENGQWKIRMLTSVPKPPPPQQAAK